MTPAEKLLWQEIRANKLGVRFRRQQVIQGFIVDFYCHQAGLVVEVDGFSLTPILTAYRRDESPSPAWRGQGEGGMTRS